METKYASNNLPTFVFLDVMHNHIKSNRSDITKTTQYEGQHGSSNATTRVFKDHNLDDASQNKGNPTNTHTHIYIVYKNNLKRMRYIVH